MKAGPKPRKSSTRSKRARSLRLLRRQGRMRKPHVRHSSKLCATTLTTSTICSLRETCYTAHLSTLATTPRLRRSEGMGRDLVALSLGLATRKPVAHRNATRGLAESDAPLRACPRDLGRPDGRASAPRSTEWAEAGLRVCGRGSQEELPVHVPVPCTADERYLARVVADLSCGTRALVGSGRSSRQDLQRSSAATMVALNETRYVDRRDHRLA